MSTIRKSSWNKWQFHMSYWWRLWPMARDQCQTGFSNFLGKHKKNISTLHKPTKSLTSRIMIRIMWSYLKWYILIIFSCLRYFIWHHIWHQQNLRKNLKSIRSFFIKTKYMSSLGHYFICSLLHPTKREFWDIEIVRWLRHRKRKILDKKLELSSNKI